MSRAWAFWASCRSRCLRPFGRRKHLEPDGHPTPALLAAYHEDRLPPEKDGEIQEHFVECPECPELMLDLDRFASKEMPVLVDDLADTRVNRAWRRLRKRLSSDIGVPRVPRPPLFWLRHPVLAWGVVGVLLPGTVGLGVRVRDLASELRLQQAPQLNLPFAVIPVPAATRSASTMPMRTELEVPPGAPRFLLMLDSPNMDRLPEYRLEIQTRKGDDVWGARGLTLNEDGRFVISLSRGFLPAGEYNIYVFGGDQNGESLIQDYHVRFSYL